MIMSPVTCYEADVMRFQLKLPKSRCCRVVGVNYIHVISWRH